MANRYTKAEDGFFGNESSDDNTNETETTEKTDTPTMNAIPNETSDWYIAMTHPTDVAAAFLKAHKDETTTWSGVPEEKRSVQLKYYKALYEKKQKIGVRQREDVTGSIRFNPSEDREDDSYAHHFGNELPTIETVDATGDELLALEAQEGVAKDSDDEPTWPEGSTDEIGRGLTPRFPVIDGKALPHYVTTESELEDALDLIAQIPDEPAIPEEQLTPLEETARAMGVKPDYIGSNLEGYPVPLELTVDEMMDTVEGLSDVAMISMMLDAEKATENRKTAVPALEKALERAKERNEEQAASSNGNTGGSGGFFEEPKESNGGDPEVPTTVDTDDVGKATKVKMAMSLVEDDGVDIDEAKAMVGL